MPALLALVFLILPIAEIALLIQVGKTVGVGWTIVLLIAMSVAGVALARNQGLSVWRRFQASLRRGEIPSTEILDGVLVLLGAALLLTPGFLTDILGLVLLVPPTRAGVRRSVMKSGKWAIFKRFPLAGAGRVAGNRARTVRARRVESETDSSNCVDN